MEVRYGVTTLLKMERTNQMGIARFVGLTILVTAMVAAAACGGDGDGNGGDGTGGTTNLARGSGAINETQERRAIRALTDYNDVADATLSQSGTTLSLFLVVADDVSNERAKELGNTFVRMTKFHGPDVKPIQKIGPGNLDYVITVTYPNEEKIAQGSKKRLASLVTWE
jgi:hypothetical protein